MSISLSEEAASCVVDGGGVAAVGSHQPFNELVDDGAVSDDGCGPRITTENNSKNNKTDDTPIVVDVATATHFSSHPSEGGALEDGTEHTPRRGEGRALEITIPSDDTKSPDARVIANDTTVNGVVPPIASPLKPVKVAPSTVDLLLRDVEDKLIFVEQQARRIVEGMGSNVTTSEKTRENANSVTVLPLPKRLKPFLAAVRKANLSQSNNTNALPPPPSSTTSSCANSTSASAATTPRKTPRGGAERSDVIISNNANTASSSSSSYSKALALEKDRLLASIKTTEQQLQQVYVLGKRLSAMKDEPLNSYAATAAADSDRGGGGGDDGPTAAPITPLLLSSSADITTDSIAFAAVRRASRAISPHLNASSSSAPSSRAGSPVTRGGRGGAADGGRSSSSSAFACEDEVGAGGVAADAAGDADSATPQYLVPSKIYAYFKHRSAAGGEGCASMPAYLTSELIDSFFDVRMPYLKYLALYPKPLFHNAGMTGTSSSSTSSLNSLRAVPSYPAEEAAAVKHLLAHAQMMRNDLVLLGQLGNPNKNNSNPNNNYTKGGVVETPEAFIQRIRSEDAVEKQKEKEAEEALLRRKQEEEEAERARAAAEEEANRRKAQREKEDAEKTIATINLPISTTESHPTVVPNPSASPASAPAAVQALPTPSEAFIDLLPTVDERKAVREAFRTLFYATNSTTPAANADGPPSSSSSSTVVAAARRSSLSVVGGGSLQLIEKAIAFVATELVPTLKARCDASESKYNALSLASEDREARDASRIRRLMAENEALAMRVERLEEAGTKLSPNDGRNHNRFFALYLCPKCDAEMRPGRSTSTPSSPLVTTVTTSATMAASAMPPTSANNTVTRDDDAGKQKENSGNIVGATGPLASCVVPPISSPALSGNTNSSNAQRWAATPPRLAITPRGVRNTTTTACATPPVVASASASTSASMAGGGGVLSSDVSAADVVSGVGVGSGLGPVTGRRLSADNIRSAPVTLSFLPTNVARTASPAPTPLLKKEGEESGDDAAAAAESSRVQSGNTPLPTPRGGATPQQHEKPFQNTRLSTPQRGGQQDASSIGTEAQHANASALARSPSASRLHNPRHTVASRIRVESGRAKATFLSRVEEERRREEQLAMEEQRHIEWLVQQEQEALRLGVGGVGGDVTQKRRIADSPYRGRNVSADHTALGGRSSQSPIHLTRHTSHNVTTTSTINNTKSYMAPTEASEAHHHHPQKDDEEEREEAGRGSCNDDGADDDDEGTRFASCTSSATPPCSGHHNPNSHRHRSNSFILSLESEAQYRFYHHHHKKPSNYLDTRLGPTRSYENAWQYIKPSYAPAAGVASHHVAGGGAGINGSPSPTATRRAGNNTRTPTRSGATPPANQSVAATLLPKKKSDHAEDVAKPHTPPPTPTPTPRFTNTADLNGNALLSSVGAPPRPQCPHSIPKPRPL